MDAWPAGAMGEIATPSNPSIPSRPVTGFLVQATTAASATPSKARLSRINKKRKLQPARQEGKSESIHQTAKKFAAASRANTPSILPHLPSSSQLIWEAL